LGLGLGLGFGREQSLRELHSRKNCERSVRERIKKTLRETINDVIWPPI